MSGRYSRLYFLILVLIIIGGCSSSKYRSKITNELSNENRNKITRLGLIVNNAGVLTHDEYFRVIESIDGMWYSQIGGKKIRPYTYKKLSDLSVRLVEALLKENYGKENYAEIYTTAILDSLCNENDPIEIIYLGSAASKIVSKYRKDKQSQTIHLKQFMEANNCDALLEILVWHKAGFNETYEKSIRFFYSGIYSSIYFSPSHGAIYNQEQNTYRYILSNEEQLVSIKLDHEEFFENSLKSIYTEIMGY